MKNLTMNIRTKSIGTVLAILALISTSSFASALTIAPVERYLVCKYNTYASDFNFLEISNTGHHSLDFEAYIPKASTHDGVSRPVSPASGSLVSFQRLDIDIHSSVGNNAFGHVVVRTFNASLNGGISYYKLVDGELKQTAYIPCFVETAPAFTF